MGFIFGLGLSIWTEGSTPEGIGVLFSVTSDWEGTVDCGGTELGDADTGGAREGAVGSDGDDSAWEGGTEKREETGEGIEAEGLVRAERVVLVEEGGAGGAMGETPKLCGLNGGEDALRLILLLVCATLLWMIVWVSGSSGVRNCIFWK